MKTKRCFLVCGPESSGNRLMTRILIRAGCYGDYNMFQRLDNEDVPPNINDIVIHRSFPFGNEGEGRHWPDLYQIINRFEEMGHKLDHIIVMSRDFRCTIKSQLKANHVHKWEQAQENIIYAYHTIYWQIMLNKYQAKIIPVTYEGLVHHPRATLGWLLPALNLPMIETEFIFDANEKWYIKTAM